MTNDSPVVGATVSLFSPVSDSQEGSGEKYTNEAGECEFNRLPAGSYSLRVFKPSFFSQAEDGISDQELRLKAGETRVVQSYLTKGGVISGRLLNSDNDCLTGIPVTAFLVDSTNVRHYQLPSSSESNTTSVTDDRGVFRIYGLRPGVYVIAVNSKRNASLRKDIPPLKYLGGSDSKTSTGVYVGFSEEIRLPDIQLATNAAGPGVIAGNVSGKGDRPIEKALVSLVGVDDPSLSDQGLTTAAGSFAFEGLELGRYRITVTSKQGPYRAFMKDVDLNTRPTILEIRLGENPTIEGRALLFRNGKSETLPLLKIALLPVAGGTSLDFVAAGGVFSVSTIRSGYFFWSLPGLARNQYLAAIKIGARDITSSPLFINDKSIRDLVIDVASGAAAIDGKFPESKPNGCKEFSTYAVLLSPTDNKVLRWKPADVCIGSSFSIFSLPPGNYYLVALPLTQGTEASPQSIDNMIRFRTTNTRLLRSEVFTMQENQRVSRPLNFLQ